MNKKLFFVIAIISTFVFFQNFANCASYNYNDYMGQDEIPYGGNAEGYGYDDFIMYDEAGAADANVPTGYSGYVLKIAQEGSGAIGFSVDLSNYIASDVEEIKFRIYCHATTKAVRMTTNGGGSWHINSTPSATEEWIEISFSNIKNITDSNGYLKQFSFGLRNSTVGSFYLYVDSITVVTTEVSGDITPPVISLETEEFYVPVGTKLRLDVDATDDSGEVNVSYLWSEGAIDRSGRLLEGKHTLTITATDAASNTASKNVFFTVSKYDVTINREFICINNAVSKCMLIVACYDDDNTLVDVMSINDVVNNVKYNIASLSDKTKQIKVFVWDSSNTLYPLSVIKKLEIV